MVPRFHHPNKIQFLSRLLHSVVSIASILVSSYEKRFILEKAEGNLSLGDDYPEICKT